MLKFVPWYQKLLSLQTEAEEKKSANCSNKLLLTTHDVHYFGTYNSLFGTFHISCEIWLNFTISGNQVTELWFGNKNCPQDNC